MFTSVNLVYKHLEKSGDIFGSVYKTLTYL